MKMVHSIKAILHHVIAFLECASTERAIGMPLDQLANQPGIQDASAKLGLVLGDVERYRKNQEQLAQLCLPAVAAKLRLVADLVQRTTYQKGVATLLIPFRYSPVVMALPLVFSCAGISLQKARAPRFSDRDFSRLTKSVGHLVGGKLFMASEAPWAAEMPAEVIAPAPVLKEGVVFDGLCRLVFYLDWQADWGVQDRSDSHTALILPHRKHRRF